MDRRQFLALATVFATAARTRAETAATSDQPLLSFGMITDVQYADADPQGERHYRESIPKLKAAAADLAKEKLPFSLHLGDVIDRDFKSFAAILPHFEGLGHPVRHLLGNHDYSIKDEEKSKVAPLLGMPADHYAFTASGVRFVMLDTNDVSTYKYQAGSPGDLEAKAAFKKLAAAKPNNARKSNGGVSQAQLAWLKKELTAADAAKQPVIVCSHHPLLPEDGHQAWNNHDILEEIESHPCVRACFCGHNHAGAEVTDKGIPCITFKSILHQPGVTAYSVVRLYQDRLEIEGRGREKSRAVSLRAMKA